MGLYDTRLSPEEEKLYQAWAKASGRANDTEDYDLRGAWKANVQEASNGHLPDTFKKPNHPTFSDQSLYSTAENKGGSWVSDGQGGWVFWASPANLSDRSMRDLQRYFQQREPGNTVVFPSNYKLPNGK